MPIFSFNSILFAICVFTFLNFVKINAFEPFKVDKYTVTPLKAYHGSPNPLIYAVSDGEKTVLYGHDTDIFPDATWEYMINNKMHFDLVSLDCTEGAYEDLNYHGHMCLGRNITCRDRMLKENLIDKKSLMKYNEMVLFNMSSTIYLMLKCVWVMLYETACKRTAFCNSNTML